MCSHLLLGKCTLEFYLSEYSPIVYKQIFYYQQTCRWHSICYAFQTFIYALIYQSGLFDQHIATHKVITVDAVQLHLTVCFSRLSIDSNQIIHSVFLFLPISVLSGHLSNRHPSGSFRLSLMHKSLVLSDGLLHFNMNDQLSEVQVFKQNIA